MTRLLASSVPSRPRSPRILAALGLVLVSLTAGCSNFDFSTVQNANGSYDRQKLMAAMEASGNDSLFSFTWIPLIYANLTLFSKTDKDYPEGHALIEASGYGPLFIMSDLSSKITDPEGKPIEETRERSWGWGLGRMLDERVETRQASRVVDENRWIFGLFGGREVRYDKNTGS